METRNDQPGLRRVIDSALLSRRRGLGLLMGVSRWLPPARAAGVEPPVRLRIAFSETIIGDVNMNDARAAMLVWVKRLTQEVDVAVEIDPKVFDTSDEIISRVRAGQMDAVALNIFEYKKVADLVDSSQVLSEAGAASFEQYMILVKKTGNLQQLGDLQNGRLILLKTPKTCLASAWLAGILDDGHYPPAEQFFRSVTADSKVSRVVLPVFFGQTEACITSKRAFETLCELNPQVAKDLKVIAVSPPLLAVFCLFSKTFRGDSREKMLHAFQMVRMAPAGRQLTTLFQFGDLEVRDFSAISAALRILEKAERARSRPAAGGRK